MASPVVCLRSNWEGWGGDEGGGAVADGGSAVTAVGRAPPTGEGSGSGVGVPVLEMGGITPGGILGGSP